MKRFILGFMCLSALCHHTFAQTKTTGQVLDALTNEPLQGVTIRLQQANIGTVTGADGSFAFQTATNTDTLLFSYVGYRTSKIALDENHRLVQLQPALNQLNQVVVSASREAQVRTEAPIAISAISKKVLLNTKPTSLEQVLNKVSGVYMVNLGNEQHTMVPVGTVPSYFCPD